MPKVPASLSRSVAQTPRPGPDVTPAPTPTPDPPAEPAPVSRADIEGLQGRAAPDPGQSVLATRLASPEARPADWGDPLPLKMAAKLFFASGTDTFTRGIAASDARSVLEGLEAARAAVAGHEGPVHLVLTLGAANGSANGTNPSVGGSVRSDRVALQNGLPPSDEPVVHVKIDSEAAPPARKGTRATFTVGGAYPLARGGASHDVEVQTAMAELAEAAIMKGGSFTLRNFISDTLHAGLEALLLAANAASKTAAGTKAPLQARVLYVEQYLQKGSEVRAVALHGQFARAAQLPNLDLARREDLTSRLE